MLILASGVLALVLVRPNTLHTNTTLKYIFYVSSLFYGFGKKRMSKRPFNFNQYTEEDLDNLSQVTEQDILAAHQTFVQAVSERFKNLILAIKIQIFGKN